MKLYQIITSYNYYTDRYLVAAEHKFTVCVDCIESLSIKDRDLETQDDRMLDPQHDLYVHYMFPGQKTRGAPLSLATRETRRVPVQGTDFVIDHTEEHEIRLAKDANIQTQLAAGNFDNSFKNI